MQNVSFKIVLFNDNDIDFIKHYNVLKQRFTNLMDAFAIADKEGLKTGKYKIVKVDKEEWKMFRRNFEITGKEIKDEIMRLLDIDDNMYTKQDIQKCYIKEFNDFYINGVYPIRDLNKYVLLFRGFRGNTIVAKRIK